MDTAKENTRTHLLEQAIQRVLIGLAEPIQGSRILVGVSGGADSMALLHVLAALQQPFSFSLVAAYVDHGLRPDETPQEWACVQGAASLLAVESERVFVDVRAEVAARKVSIEHAARELRYQAFAALGQQWKTDLLAVAHTADDQVEAILLRLFRGGGRKALAGMRLRTGRLIRPFLGIRKAILLDYLNDKGISFCHDSSNDNVSFLRNRIRLELLPALEARFDPGIRSAVLKTATNLAEDEELLEDLLSQCWDTVVESLEADVRGFPTACLNREAFQGLHLALQRRLIEQLLWKLDAVAQYEQILAVLAAGCSGRSGSELHLSRGLRLVVTRLHLIFSYPQGKGPWRGRL